ncbi:MAG: aminotransferase class I/II-fold pyridoxal phosphate-dependent enzyme [Acidimicrobiia bacterium]
MEPVPMGQAKSTEPVPPAGAHGGDVVAVARALGVEPSQMVDLSVSLNPYAPDVFKLAARHLEELGRYPDTRYATALLAEAVGVEAERILLTNGGSEAIALVCHHMRRAAVPQPEFSLYARHLEKVVDPDEEPSAPVIRSNPNNPTGRLAGAEERAEVWDEAFYPLATGTWTRGEGTVVGSLTKVFACPGLRLGYLMGEAELIERLSARQPRWAVNPLAAGLLPDLLERAELPAWRDAIAEAREALTRALPGVLPSDAPYVLVEAPGGAAATRARLARRGVLVRDCTNFGLPGHVRIAVPDQEGLKRLLKAWQTMDG